MKCLLLFLSIVFFLSFVALGQSPAPGSYYFVSDDINPNQFYWGIRDSFGGVKVIENGNGLSSPREAVFDGERILVTNLTGGSVSLWKASDLTPIGTFPTGTGTQTYGACSDGVNFWITLRSTDRLARF